MPNLAEVLCGGSGNWRIHHNQLTELDLSNVPGLTSLWCDANRLTNLDLSAVPGLTTLWCCGNQLTELDVRANTALRELECDPSVKVKRLSNQNFKRYE